MIVSRKQLIYGLFLGSAISAWPAYAQDAAADAGAANETDEIVVTAQKRSERLSDVPMSITAASGDALLERGIKTAGDLQNVVPGFSYTESAYGAPIFTIRGIGFYDEAVAIAPTVSIYSDQVPVPFSRMAEGVTLDLERVEILKGPQGTLFGQNSTGGAINYIAAKPTKTFEAGANVGFARFGSVDAQGYVSGPLADGLTARLAGQYQRSGDWQRSVTSDRTLGSRRFWSGRLLVDFVPTDTVKLELNINGWRNQSDAQAPQYRKYSAITPTSTDGANPAFAGFLGSIAQPNLDNLLRTYPVRDGNRYADWDPDSSFRRNDSFYQVSLRGDVDLTDNITLTSISAYHHLLVDKSPNEADGTEYLGLYVVKEAKIDSFSQELRIAGSFGESDQLKFMVGGNYQKDDTEDNQILTFDGTNTGLFKGAPFEFRYAGSGLRNNHDEKITSKAVFGSLDYNVTDTLTAQGSIRYTDNTRKFSGCLADKGDGILGSGFGLLSNVLNGVVAIPNPGDRSYVAPGNCVSLVGDPTSPDFNRPVRGPIKSTLPENNVSWRLGLSWKATPQTLLYTNVTRGYKSGSFGTLPYLTDTQIQPIEQEKLTAYEVGFKTSVLDRKLDLSAAAFYYDYVNKQLLGYLFTGPIFGNLPGEVSIPKSEVKGAEVSIIARPVRGLNLSAAATYIDSKVKGEYRTSSPDALYSFQPSVDSSCPPGSTVGSCGVNIEGSPFTYTPKWNLIGDAQYEFDLNGDWRAFVGSSVNYRSSTSSVFAAPPDGTPVGNSYTTASDYKLPSYALVDVRAGVATSDGKYRIQFWGRNITNKYYWIHVIKIQDTLARVTGKPATYGVTLTARY